MVICGMEFPIKFSAQLKEQLRSLRKVRGLSQADLGALIGVNQRRIADIESNPGAVGLDQIMKLLSALRAEIVIRDVSSPPDLSVARKPSPVFSNPPAFLAPPPASARHLLAVLRGNRTFSPEAPLWPEELPYSEARLPSDFRRQLVGSLAHEMGRNQVFLSKDLEQARDEQTGSGNVDGPIPPIWQQWADALAVTPAGLKWAVERTQADRYRPPGLDRTAAKGEW